MTTVNRLIGYDNNDQDRNKKAVKITDGSVAVQNAIPITGVDGKLPESVIPSTSDDSFINAIIFGG